jgi:hypothetical protein
MKTDLKWAKDVSHGRKDMTSTTTPSSGTLNTEFKDRACGLQNDWHVRASALDEMAS